MTDPKKTPRKPKRSKEELKAASDKIKREIQDLTGEPIEINLLDKAPITLADIDPFQAKAELCRQSFYYFI